MSSSAIKVIITGSTGMVGEGVTHECLQHPEVAAVLLINRKASGIRHPKLKEVIHENFYDLTPIEDELKGYTACFFCLGTTSVGMSEQDYSQVTYTLTLNVASTLSRLNSDMTFCYISGYGTDRTEKGKIMWARVKGKTENDLLKLPFKGSYFFRPLFLAPYKGSSKTHAFYYFISWFFPLGRLIFPNGFCTLKELALAMITVSNHGFRKTIILGKDIANISNSQSVKADLP